MQTFDDIAKAFAEYNARVEALVKEAETLALDGAVLEQKAHKFGFLKRRIRAMLAKGELRYTPPEQAPLAQDGQAVARVPRRHAVTCASLNPTEERPCGCGAG